MKKILLITFLVGMMACNENQSADIKPTDVDQTDNDDTVPRPETLPDSAQNRSDSTRL